MLLPSVSHSCELQLRLVNAFRPRSWSARAWTATGTGAGSARESGDGAGAAMTRVDAMRLKKAVIVAACILLERMGVLVKSSELNEVWIAFVV